MKTNNLLEQANKHRNNAAFLTVQSAFTLKNICAVCYHALKTLLKVWNDKHLPPSTNRILVTR